MLDILARLLTLLAFLLASAPLSPPDNPARLTAQSGPRLAVESRLGGQTRAAILLGAEVILAEDDTLVRLPVVGPDAYQAQERLPLDAGLIVDLAAGPPSLDTLYVLTTQQLLTLRGPSLEVVQRIAGGGSRLALGDGQLYVAAGQAGGRVYTLSPEGLTRYAAQLPAADGVQAITRNMQQVLAAADGTAGVRFFNLSSPDGTPASTLSALSALPGLHPATHLASFGNFIYATRGHTVHVLNSTDPQHPAVMSTYAPLHSTQDVTWQPETGYLLAADGVDGLKVYAAPSLDATPRYLNSQQGQPARRVALDAQAGLVLVSHSDGLALYDARRLPDIARLGTVPLWSPPTALALAVEERLALVGLGPGGIALVDYSQPSAPVVREHLPFSGPVQDVVLHPADPTLAYVLLSDGRLLSLRLNWQQPRQSAVIRDLPVPGRPQDLALDAERNLLGVASGRAGVHFFDLVAAATVPRLLFTQPAQATETVGVMALEVTPGGEWLAADGDRVQVWRLVGRGRAHILHEQAVGVQGAAVLHATPEGVWWAQANHLRAYRLSGATLQPATSYAAPRGYHGLVALLGQLVLAGDSPATGLLLLDVSDPFRPLEQQIIPTPFRADAFTIRGDDVLLVNRAQGLAHLRLRLPEARHGPLQPVLAGEYRPVQGVTHLLPLEPGRWGLTGPVGGELAGDQVAPAPALPVDVQAAYRLPGSDLLLIDGEWQVWRQAAGSAPIPTPLQAVALVVSSDLVWAIDPAGQLQALEPSSLKPLDPSRTTQFDIQPTSLVQAGEHLLVGTQDGVLLRLRPPQGEEAADSLLTNQLPGLGGPVTAIDVLPAPRQQQVVVSAGAGGLWWLRLAPEGRFEVLARSTPPLDSYAAALSPDARWLAVAAGECGLHVLDAGQPDLGLRPFARWTDGVVTDVHFEAADRLLAVVDGAPARLRFNPQGTPLAPPPPSRPVPPHNQPLTEPVTELRWQPQEPVCGPLTYEIYINGQRAGTTITPGWTLDAPARRDFTWQVVAMGQDGTRTAGPQWRALPPVVGWQAAPPQMSVASAGQPTGSETPWSILLVLLGLLGGLAGLVVLWRVYQAVTGKGAQR